jgi:hypothetical protein
MMVDLSRRDAGAILNMNVCMHRCRTYPTVKLAEKIYQVIMKIYKVIMLLLSYVLSRKRLHAHSPRLFWPNLVEFRTSFSRIWSKRLKNIAGVTMLFCASMYTHVYVVIACDFKKIRKFMYVCMCLKIQIKSSLYCECVLCVYIIIHASTPIYSACMYVCIYICVYVCV